MLNCLIDWRAAGELEDPRATAHRRPEVHVLGVREMLQHQVQPGAASVSPHAAAAIAQ